MNDEIKNLANRFWKRELNPTELEDFCKNHLPKVLSADENLEHGQVVEFIIQEYYQKILGFPLFKNTFETESENFAYSGGDRADIRAANSARVLSTPFKDK